MQKPKIGLLPWSPLLSIAHLLFWLQQAPSWRPAETQHSGGGSILAAVLFTAASHSHGRAYCTKKLCHCTAYLRCKFKPFWST